MKSNGTRHERGAYFTPPSVADVLAAWAIESPTDTVLDPAAGAGQLLRSAYQRMESLGKLDPGNLFGVELHKRTHRSLRTAGSELGIPARNLIRSDFFVVHSKLKKVDVVVANPPYVRHHDIPDRALKRMKEVIARSGWPVSGKASSWAYFVIGSTLLLKVGGRFSAVLPSEILSTDYGRSVTRFLEASFGVVELRSCGADVFEEPQVRVVLVRGVNFQPSVSIVEADALPDTPPRLKASPVKIAGRNLPLLRLAPATVRSDVVERLLREVAGRCDQKVGDLGSVRIGYVAGASKFFQLSDSARREMGLRRRDLTPVLCRGSYFDGLRFASRDWEELRRNDSPCWLFTPSRPVSAAANQLIRRGARSNVSARAKCASRIPWWIVPLPAFPHAIVNYMGGRIRIISNAAGVYVPNTLYGLTMYSPELVPEASLASMTSAFQLSAQTYARDKGAGLRKLEPSDFKKVLLPIADRPGSISREVDSLLRKGKWNEASDAADDFVLRYSLGLSVQTVKALGIERDRLKSP